jgi:polysaccharide export outer membrane protein
MHSYRLCLACRLLILPLAIAASVVSARPSVAQQPQPESGGCPVTYVIGPEDVLEIAVWSNADITRTVPVRLDGKISLPLLNDVQAAGLTPMHLRETLTTALNEYIPNPAVAVLVRETHSFKVSVIGQVKTPGRYELKDRATVLDVLAMAGGLNEYAARGRIVVLRQEATTTRQIPFPYDRLTAKNGSKSGSTAGGPENFCVRPGDVVLVP